ncbi:MAG: hypothetical protein D6771_01085, partial [Zetaproteobacteria bacterium]
MPQFAHPYPWIDALWSLGVFFAFAWAVRRFVLPPVRQAIEARRQAIEAALAEAEAAREQAERFRREYEAKLAAAEEEARALRERLLKQARAEREAMLKEAQARIERLRRQLREDAEAERWRVRRALLQEAADWVALVGEKLIRREIRAEDADRLVNEAIGALEREAQS